MRIALLSAPGGQTVHVAELANALARGGHDVRIYSRRDRPDLPDVAPTSGAVDVIHVPAGPPEAISQDALLRYTGAFGQRLADRWLADTWVPDVVHAHLWMSGLAALTARRRSDVPVVLTYHALGVVKRRHQGELDTSPAGRIGYERILGQRADRVVARCRDEVKELVEAGVPRRRIVVVPSGVDHRHFTPDGPRVPRDADRPRVLTVGRFVARKGFREVVRAMRRVPDAELVIVGGPPSGDLRGDPVRRLSYSAAAVDRARSVYSWQSTADRLSAVYTAVQPRTTRVVA